MRSWPLLAVAIAACATDHPLAGTYRLDAVGAAACGGIDQPEMTADDWLVIDATGSGFIEATCLDAPTRQCGDPKLFAADANGTLTWIQATATSAADPRECMAYYVVSTLSQDGARVTVHTLVYAAGGVGYCTTEAAQAAGTSMPCNDQEDIVAHAAKAPFQ